MPNVWFYHFKKKYPFTALIVAGHQHLVFQPLYPLVQDAEDAFRAAEEFKKAGFKGHVYLMPVGGVESVYQLNNKAVALMAMKKGWRYSDRLQVPLFKNEWGT